MPVPLPSEEDRRIAALRSLAPAGTAGDPALADLAQLAAQVTGCPFATITLVERDTARCDAAFGLPPAAFPRAASFCAEAIRQPAQPLVVPDAAADPRFAANPLVAGAPGIRFYAGSALLTGDGHAIGALGVMDTAPRDMAAGTAALLPRLARAVVTTLALRRAMRQAEDLALVDALTELPNRASLRIGLGQAIARQRRDRRPFSLLCLGLDGMGALNEREGRAAGDLALREAGTALMLCLREEDTAARLEGDRFAALLVGGDGAEAAVVGERVRHAVQETMAAHGWPVTASVGAACFLDPPEDEEHALSFADDLMGRAKSRGGNRVVCVDHAAAAYRGGARHARPLARRVSPH
ncbi:GGDEF domain-containing protein [Falsiroseomonas sp. CW058]|uniref:GGDEF domain-containing protein n=1 Tax=Falsiroseomonas sp. CW058 TaxID=3388664 RepID=UPI003D31ED23